MISPWCLFDSSLSHVLSGMASCYGTFILCLAPGYVLSMHCLLYLLCEVRITLSALQARNLRIREMK